MLVQQALLASPTAALVVDLYRWPQGRVAKSGLRNAAIASLGRGRSSADSPNPSPSPETLAKSGRADVNRVSRSSAGSSSASSQEEPETLRLFSQTSSASQSDAKADSPDSETARKADSLVPVGRVTFPLRHLPEDRDGGVAELEGVLVGAPLQEAQVMVEIQAWDAAQYSAEQLKAQQPSDEAPGKKHQPSKPRQGSLVNWESVSEQL